MRRSTSEKRSLGTMRYFVSTTQRQLGVATKWSMSPILAISVTECATAHPGAVMAYSIEPPTFLSAAAPLSKWLKPPLS